jgi:hypothetical protein
MSRASLLRTLASCFALWRPASHFGVLEKLLQLGPGLFDWIQARPVGLPIEQLRADGFKRLANPTTICPDRLCITATSPGLSCAHSTRSTYVLTTSPPQSLLAPPCFHNPAARQKMIGPSSLYRGDTRQSQPSGSPITLGMAILVPRQGACTDLASVSNSPRKGELPRIQ